MTGTDCPHGHGPLPLMFDVTVFYLVFWPFTRPVRSGILILSCTLIGLPGRLAVCPFRTTKVSRRTQTRPFINIIFQQANLRALRCGIQCMQPALFVALDVFWIPRRSAELKVAVKAMTVTENLAYRWLHIVAIFTYHTPELRMNPFRRVKDGLWTCERPSFRSQKTAFCEALRNMLISNRLQARSERAVNKRREGRQQEA